MSQWVHGELSFRVKGVLLDVYNSLGPMLKEEYYRDAILLGLEDLGIGCEGEKPFEVFYEGERVGLYYVDVWIEGGKILLELKVAATIEPIHKAQAISYLKITDADLAIVATYGGPSLGDERLPNFLRQKQPVFTRKPQPADSSLLHSALYNIIENACYRVHFALGPGFFHQVYRRAMLIELRRCGVNHEYLKQLPVEYRGRELGQQDVRLILVDDKVLLAPFALRQPDDGAVEKLKSCMRRLGVKLGMLANFYGNQASIVPVRVQ